MALVPYPGKSTLMPVDWESRCAKLAIKSDSLKLAGRLNRYRTDQDTLNIHCQLQNAAHQSKIGLSYRIQDVEKVKEILLEYLEAIRSERSDLLEALNAVVHAVDDVRPLMDVLKECLALRRDKNAAETLDDDARRELHRASSALDDVEDRLQRLRSDVERHHLQTTLELEGRLMAAANDQQLTLEIDRSQLSLTEHSPDLSTILDQASAAAAAALTRGQGTTMSEIWWEEQMVSLLADTQDVLGRSKSMRESAHLELIRARNEQRARKEAVQYALRKGIHRLGQAVQNLFAQHDTLKIELAAINENIRDAERYRRDMRQPMRLAHTRLENRRERPEPCYDLAQRRLESQVELLGTANDMMDRRLEHTRMTRAHLEGHLDDVRKELNSKNEALDIDRKCLDIMDRFDKETFSEIRSVKPNYPETFPVPILRNNSYRESGQITK